MLFAAAGIAGLISKKQVQQTYPVPQQTVDSVKQDINEVKEARHDRPLIQASPNPAPTPASTTFGPTSKPLEIELGQTVEALSAKLDVKHQAKQKVDATKELIVDKAQTVRSKGSDVGSHVVDVATDDEGSIRPVVPVAAVGLDRRHRGRRHMEAPSQMITPRSTAHGRRHGRE